ncbi:MAG: ATP-binding protein [Myxococcota bacterium]
MKRSLSRLVVRSVLVCWALSFAVLVSYGVRLAWTEERARRDGVFLVQGMLEELPAAEREARLEELRPHFWPPFHLMSVDEARARLARDIAPGDRVHQRVAVEEEWYYLAFEDGDVLAAGPVNPTRPPYAFPVAVPVIVLGLPLIAAFVALRVGRELAKVEGATKKLAAGELSARVDNPAGPSNELAAAFNVMAERLERLVRSRDELVQAVSHELGSPLARLRFRIALLDEPSKAGAPLPADERAARIAAMTGEIDALDELVAELLSYVQSDELRLERQAFDPRQPLADLAELASLEVPEERAIEVELALDDVEVFADRRLFARAVENVLRNAMRHAAARVRLEVSAEGRSVWVAVHDDGPGIPPEQRAAVTAPFTRLSPERDRETGGVGLGLAIVARIMDRHGGELRIETSELGGAHVATRWPARR